MAKQDKRRNIKVNESVFEDFSYRCHAYNFTHSEMLQSLLQKEITKTEIIDSKMNARIEPSAGFNHIVKEMSKRGD